MSTRRSPHPRPRGRLPRRVYWFRRLLVLGTAFALVYAVAHLLGAGGGTNESTARITAAHPRRTTPSPTGFVGPLAAPTGGSVGQPGAAGATAAASTAPAVPLATPSGPCVPDDVSVTPEVTGAAAGGAVAIRLQLTGTQPACSFTVSPRSVVVKVTSGNDRIWSSQDCPKAVPTRTVAVRSAVTTSVQVTWNGRRSDGHCSHTTPWAEPGYYHALAAALGSEPSDAQFRLSLPSRPVITRTARPHPQRAKGHPSAAPASPSGSASAQVDGKQSACGGDNVC